MRYGTPKDASQTYVLHEGPIGVFDGTLQEESYGLEVPGDEAEDGAKVHLRLHRRLDGHQRQVLAGDADSAAGRRR